MAMAVDLGLSSFELSHRREKRREQRERESFTERKLKTSEMKEDRKRGRG